MGSRARLRCCTGVLVAAIASLSAVGALANELAFGAKTPSVQDFVEGLKPQPQVRMRGIRPTQAQPQQQVAEASAPAVSMQLRFAFNSAELSPESRQTLDNLSSALKQAELASSVFMVEGHTDASGSDSYNMQLSENRANSVVRYLVSKGVDQSHLRAVGKGETELLDQNDPNNPANRRVAIVNTGNQMLGGN